MWNRTVRVLTTIVSVSADRADVIEALQGLLGSYREADAADADVRYRFDTAGVPRLLRDDVELYPADHLLDLVPYFEGLLYQSVIETAAASSWVLHAAAVVVAGRAVVLAGESGDGKSTSALAMVIGGAGYISDEYAALDAGGGVLGVARPIAFVDGAAAMPVPPAFRPAGYRIRDRTDQVVTHPMYHPPADQLRHDPVPLAAIVRIRYRPDEAGGARLLGPGEALAELWPCTMNPDDATLDRATAAVGACPVHELRTTGIESACAAIRALVRTAG